MCVCCRVWASSPCSSSAPPSSPSASRPTPTCGYLLYTTSPSEPHTTQQVRVQIQALIHNITFKTSHNTIGTSTDSAELFKFQVNKTDSLGYDILEKEHSLGFDTPESHVFCRFFIDSLEYYSRGRLTRKGIIPWGD